MSGVLVKSLPCCVGIPEPLGSLRRLVGLGRIDYRDRLVITPDADKVKKFGSYERCDGGRARMRPSGRRASFVHKRSQGLYWRQGLRSPRGFPNPCLNALRRDPPHVSDAFESATPSAHQTLGLTRLWGVSHRRGNFTRETRSCGSIIWQFHQPYHRIAARPRAVSRYFWFLAVGDSGLVISTRACSRAGSR